MPGLRRYEWLLVAFFSYIAAFSLVLRRPAGLAAAFAGLSIVVGIARIDVVTGRPWTRVLRDWMSPGYILAAYWSLAPLARGPEARHYDAIWVQWDRVVLHHYGLQALLEMAGGLFPASLEFVYLLLYGLPTALVGWFYWRRRRDRLECFLEVMFAATLVTYAMIPLFPSGPPRLEFPGADFPNYLSALRRLNLWLQNGADISTGVFPSGHVTVAVGCWFGLRRALPQERRLLLGLAVYTGMLMLSTIYGRYHYAADVAAAFTVALCAARLTQRLEDWHPDLLPDLGQSAS